MDHKNNSMKNSDPSCSTNNVTETSSRKKFKTCRKESSLENRMQALLDSGKFSDVTISTKGKEFKAHRSILATCSSEFQVMFNKETFQKQSNQIVIEDFSSEAVSQLLKYIYTNKIDQLTPELNFDLLRAAYQYKINGLRDVCRSESISVDLVVPSLILADLYDDNTLKEDAICKFLSTPADIIDSEDWSQFKKTHSELSSLILKRLVGERAPAKAKKTVHHR